MATRSLRASRRRLFRAAVRAAAAFAPVPFVGACALPAAPWAAQAGQATPTPGRAGPAPSPTPRPAPSGMGLTSFASVLPGRLLFVADSNVWLLERGQLRPITTDKVSRQPSWSHDGRRIALIKLWTSGSDLWAVDANGQEGLELTDFTYREDPRQNYALQPIWSADDSRVLFLSQEGTQDTQLWQVGLADRRRLRYLTHGERFGGVDHPRLSPDGRLLAVSSFQPGRGPEGRPQIWTYSLPGGPWRQLTDAPGGAYDPEWSPDGRIAYTVRTPDASRTAGRHDVWTMRADGTAARAVTSSGLNRAPSWSPDGAWLLFLSARSGTFEVWAVPAPADTTVPASGTPPPGAASGTARQVTQGGAIDVASGLSWTR